MPDAIGAPDAPGHSGPAAWDVEPGGSLRLSGDWSTHGIDQASARLREDPPQLAPGARLDASGIVAFDTNGAYLLHRVAVLGDAVIDGLNEERSRLLELVRSRLDGNPAPRADAAPGLLVRTGRATVALLDEAYSLLAFLGETLTQALRSASNPAKFSWRGVAAIVQRSGADALPIVGLLSFLLGVVIAYQGGVQLKNYGASIFVVELTALTVLREIGPMMAAIIVAGRTGSAYAAELATMRVSEEIDALRTLGISPVERLVLPKLFGLVIALPLLTVFADAAGIVGGMVMAATLLDVPMVDFAGRLGEVVAVRHVLLGLVKAPVFAMVIVMVGCFQGMRAQGGADSVGRQTTTSVVQSIFLVIVIDALFSITFSIFKL